MIAKSKRSKKMIKRMLKASSLILLVAIITGCASLGGGNISTNNPNAYGDYQIDAFSNQEVIGKEAILGGMITTMNSQGESVRVELVRYELDNDGYPLIRNGAIDNNRLVVDIYGVARINGYAPGDYITVVGDIKSAEDVKVGGEKIRVLTLDAVDYKFWRDPRREIYYDEPFFNSPAIGFGYYRSGFGMGYNPYFPYYY